MKAIDLVVLALAVWHAVEVYHHGSIFANLRDWFQTRVWDWLAMLTGCMFCLSFWISLVLTVWWLLATYWPDLMVGLRSPIYMLAVCRLANLLNDLTHPWCRTPRE